MPFRVLVIGDPHFKVSNIRETNLMTERIVALAEERKPDLIVCLGDILDRHETIHVTPLVKATAFLHQLRLIAPLVAIIGNHDRPNNSTYLTDEHPFSGLKHWKNTTIVDQGADIRIKGHRFIFVPYVPPGRFLEAIKSFVTDDPEDPDFLSNVTCVFAHQEFLGAKMGAIRSEIGDPWPLNYPYVISGHIHDYDQLASNILYTGTPIQHAFGDRDDKTVSWVEWPDRAEGPAQGLQEVNRADLEYTQPCIPTQERIDLGLPKKVIVHLSCTDIVNYQPPPNTQLKIVVMGTSAEIKAAMKLTNIKTLISAGVKVVFRDVPSTKKADQVEPIKITKKKYTELLQHAIIADPPLVKIYQRIVTGQQQQGPKLIIV
jgi:DNA repair exonuclease SbcCD nuclease subunit